MMANDPKVFTVTLSNTGRAGEISAGDEAAAAILGGPPLSTADRFEFVFLQYAEDRGLRGERVEQHVREARRALETWPSYFVSDLGANLMADRGERGDRVVAFLVFKGFIPLDSPLVSDAMRALFERRVRDLPPQDIGWMNGALDDYAALGLGQYLPDVRGATDEELAEWKARALELPAPLAQAFHICPGESDVAMVSYLGISDRGVPAGDRTIPKVELKEEPDPPKNGIDRMRRALWRIVGSDATPPAILHAHIEGTLGRLTKIPDYFLHALALWTYNFPNAGRAILLSMRAIDADSPLAGGPEFLAMWRTPLVRHSSGRAVARQLVHRAEEGARRHLESVDTRKTPPPTPPLRYLQHKDMKLQIEAEDAIYPHVYNEASVLIYPAMLAATKPIDALCLLHALGFTDSPYPESEAVVKSKPPKRPSNRPPRRP